MVSSAVRRFRKPGQAMGDEGVIEYLISFVRFVRAVFAGETRCSLCFFRDGFVTRCECVEGNAGCCKIWGMKVVGMDEDDDDDMTRTRTMMDDAGSSSR